MSAPDRIEDGAEIEFESGVGTGTESVTETESGIGVEIADRTANRDPYSDPAIDIKDKVIHSTSTPACLRTDTSLAMQGASGTRRLDS
ncbi:hypothetical protein EVAR_22694_1 [Eumeta japonica]|uniref:Uncharacterized protein n=1 Tax=Eumeta variegata TaxID=151549 RepID=A0A4C1US74_EUMVA|nr:hypothetical protein EVAR_22694_1 [Eumeta japonica]